MYNERDDLFNIDLCNDILIKYFFFYDYGIYVKI